MRRTRSCWLGLLFLATDAVCAVNFQKDVRPILSNHCFQCHGPDSEKRQAGLRLDTQAGVLSKSPRGSIVIPGDPVGSLLMQRVGHAKPALRMPPPYAHKDLSPVQVKTLEDWIASGAVWKEHWSFRAPVRPSTPAVSKPDWVRNPIDAFILGRLDKERLTPAIPEEKGRLLRRLSLDVTGLPPSPPEVAAFVNDKRPDAYERAVDRYLESEHWGEHRARYWLDAARYGDTHGLHADNYREIWPFRDWVIRAFNANMPFDRFTVEQIAGDLLESPTVDQKIATGFHRCNVTTNEGGVIPEEVHTMYVKDRVDTTATVWLGLTLGCATCHDHKYDPLTQKDFYTMAAFFNNTAQPPLDGNIPAPEPVLIIPRDADKTRLAALEPQVEELRRKLEIATGNAKVDDAGKAAIEANRKKLQSSGGKPEGQLSWNRPFTLQILFSEVEVERAVLSSYSGPEMRLEIDLESMFPVVRMQDRGGNKLAVQGSGARIGPGSKQEITVTYDGSGAAEGIGIYVAGRPITLARLRAGGLESVSAGWNIDQKFTRNISLYSRALAPLEVLGAAGAPDTASQALLQLVLKDSGLQALSNRLEAAEKELRQIRLRGHVTLVMKEKPGSEPQAHILKRGQYDQPAELVKARTPEILPPMRAGLPANRLGLARWLVDPENPLTARVAVNRFWQEVFGTGLVKTAEDFGATGEPPVNQELLDWLAVEFRESGWDVKHLFRLMLTSAAYGQAAIADAEKIRRDPENRLLARGPRFRMDGETIRDLALAASGSLNAKIGGPSLKPYQPDGVWEAVAVLFSNTRFYHQDSGSDLYRRSLYTLWKRSAPPAAMDILNAPTRESCVVRRERTDTPLQSLVTLNDPQFFEAAQKLAQVAIESSLDRDARLDAMTLRILARTMNPAERASVFQTHQRLTGYFAGNPEEARKIAPAAAHTADAAAWVMVASQLLNLDEALNK